ncbi:MAG: 30S ribosomal protein S8 [Firmicutes bacterium]|nr:30S ribosomal protein S8 [Bacillota bacterium]
MVVSDPIADLLTRIRNANMVYHEKVEVPGSKMKRAIVEILKREGYIRDYEWIDDGKQGIIRIYLKYGPGKARVIQGLKRVSKPGRRIYAKKDQIPRVLGGLGIAILSTSKGIVTDKEARRLGVGGEVLCYVW